MFQTSVANLFFAPFLNENERNTSFEALTAECQRAHGLLRHDAVSPGQRSPQVSNEFSDFIFRGQAV